jgi:GNAT superfamily N-acetyltransferase
LTYQPLTADLRSTAEGAIIPLYGARDLAGATGNQETAMNYKVGPVRSSRELNATRDLIREYVHWLDIDLAIEGFEAELPQFPEPYAPPTGDLLLAQTNAGEALGCISLRALDASGTWEIKRLYVRAGARGAGIGRGLVQAVLERASAIGYRQTMLDTLPWMTSAIAIYRAFGFAPIPAYWNNAVPDIIYFGKKLEPGT